MNREENREVSYTEVSDSAVMALVPVVSVHMITYNHGPYLVEAIEGVIAQRTDFPIELVLGEDCSTDNTREIALDYQRRYPHLIRVIYSDHNVGMMRNFFRVIDACRGEFIAFCEGDDYWIDSDKLREQVTVLSRFKSIDITFHSCYVKFEKQRKKVLQYVAYSDNNLFTLKDVIGFNQYAMPTASIVLRRSLLLSIQNRFETVNPPIGDYFLRVFGSQRGGAYYINKPMSVYRVGAEGSWSKETIRTSNSLLEFQKIFIWH